MFINIKFMVIHMAKLTHTYTDAKYLEATYFRVKYRDYFDMRQLYLTMHEWLVQEEYATREDYTFPETYYMHRETLQSGNEGWIWWRLRKVPNKNTYYRYTLDVDFHILMMRDAEIMHEGRKVKTNWGEVEVKIWAKLEGDYEKKWRKSPIMKHFEDLFRQRIFFKDFQMHKIEFYREAYRFQEFIKTYLKLRTYLPEVENEKFFAPLGHGDIT